MIVDTHAHLTDDTLFSQLDSFLAQAEQASVRAILCVGTTVETSRRAVEIAEKFSCVRAAVGIHPNNCCQANAGEWSEIEQLCRHPRVAALGETGLDRYWDDCPWETQVQFLRQHFALSRQTGLPVVIHTRECAEETLEILCEEARLGDLSGVMHSFTGSLEVAQGCLELGLYISFAGMVTFKNGVEILEVAKLIPSDRLLVETDAPYLTPHPFRGKRPNHPALVVHTLECIAKVRGVPFERLAESTSENAARLFGPW
ncbi:MAG: TatD family hydrolase [Planctomycetales bacterium]|nr:TatD family hydrolase [Planctomycetales bacterium]